MLDTPVLDDLDELDELDELVTSGSDEPLEADHPIIGEPAGRRRLRVSRLITVGLTVLVVALGAAAGYLGWNVQNSNDIKAAGDAALSAATSYAVVLTSVDSTNLDANFAAVLDGATGEFQDMYRKSSTQLRQLLIDHKATGHGVVLESAIQSASKDQVVVLLFIDQTVSNTEVPDPRVDRSRMVLTMRHAGGAWKAAKVELP